MRTMNKTKIIATIGPGTSTEDKLIALINAGANIFRINTSHESVEVHAERINSIRKIAKSMNKHIAILLDLQGPKIRIGNLKEPIELTDGMTVLLKPGMEHTDPETIPVDYMGIVNDVRKGDRILLDDGKLEFKVISTTQELVTAEVVHGGLLKQRKGLNVPGATTSISAITERDIEFIKFGVEHKVDYIALSFVRTKEDILKAKHYLKAFGGDIPVIAKLEKPQAVDNMSSIIQASDGVMVARGDLGIEISPEKVPIVQKHIINEANAQRKAVIVATQMLESMIEQPMPTRAEASDVANAIIDGADAVMLSGETAVGKYPAEAVKMMSQIAYDVEHSDILRLNLSELKAKEIYELDSLAITSAVIKLVEDIEVQAIITFTKKGYTAKLLSKAKPSVPIIAISDDEQVCRRLNLLWGVIPHHLDLGTDLDKELLEKLDKLLIEKTFLCPGDKIVTTGSIPYLVTGKTNFIRVHQVGSIGTMYQK